MTVKEKWQAFLQRLKAPSKRILVLNYIITVLSAVGALLTLLVSMDNVAWDILSYALYGLAAISLSYTVYTIVIFAPKMKKSVMDGLGRYEFTRALTENYGFRTVFFAIGTFSMNILFGMYNGALGILGKSIWFGALAAYYVLLAFLRGGILMYHNRKRTGRSSESENRFRQIKIYRNGGILLLLLNMALSSAMAQMIFNDEGFHYPGWTIYAFAAYAFYKISMAIYNLFKAKKQDDLTVQSIRNINLMDATVSILALQTALLHTFATEGLDISLYNTLTASAVTVVGWGLAISMIVVASRKKKELQTEKTGHEQQRI